MSELIESEANNKTNVVLVGMPGSGKSTLGIMLAKHLVKEFVDTDVLLQQHAGQSLQSVLDQQGYMALRQLEEQVLLQHHFTNSIVATGGSAVYSHTAMQQLSDEGVVVYLQVSLSELQQRITNFDSRGIACKPGQSFESLFAERSELYQRYADVTVDCNSCTQDEALQRVLELLPI